MLTLAEKLLFLAAVVVSFYLSYLRFSQLYLVVRRGAGEFPTRRELAGRLAHAARQMADLRQPVEEPAAAPVSSTR